MRVLRSAAVMDRTPQVLPVRSLRDALPLYRDGLGFALVQQTLSRAMLELPATAERLELHVMRGRGNAQFEVDDVGRATAAVLHNGGEIRSPLLNLAIGRHITCLDLDGNRLDLIERTVGGRS